MGNIRPEEREAGKWGREITPKGKTDYLLPFGAVSRPHFLRSLGWLGHLFCWKINKIPMRKALADHAARKSGILFQHYFLAAAI
jgi:hypothetical protein